MNWPESQSNRITQDTSIYLEIVIVKLLVITDF